MGERRFFFATNYPEISFSSPAMGKLTFLSEAPSLRHFFASQGRPAFSWNSFYLGSFSPFLQQAIFLFLLCRKGLFLGVPPSRMEERPYF